MEDANYQKKRNPVSMRLNKAADTSNYDLPFLIPESEPSGRLDPILPDPGIRSGS